MDRKAIVEAWTNAQENQKDEGQLLNERRAMRAEFRAEARLNTALFKELKRHSQDYTEREIKAFGFDSTDNVKLFAIGLGSVIKDCAEIYLEARIIERRSSGLESTGGAQREIVFRAGLLGEELSTVPGGHFSATLSPIYDHCIDARLTDIKTLNQQFTDVAKIIGVEIPSLEPQAVAV